MFSNIYDQSKLVTKLINKSNRTILFLQKKWTSNLSSSILVCWLQARSLQFAQEIRFPAKRWYIGSVIRRN